MHVIRKKKIIDNWHVAPSFYWQIMLWSWHPHWQLTDHSWPKFDLTSYVSITTFILTTDIWFQILLTNRVLSSTSLLTTDRWFQIIWSILTTERWIGILSDHSFHLLHPYWDHRDGLKVTDGQVRFWSQHRQQYYCQMT